MCHIFGSFTSCVSRDHIGIVLSCEGDSMVVAEGNVDNMNKSGIVMRKRHEKVDGYIRIDNNYTYQGWKYDYKTWSQRLVPYTG